MTTSENIGELAKALAEAQGEMKNAPFNATNPHLKNKFANLASVRDTVVPVLSKHGIAVAQTLVPIDGRCAVATRLMHASGQWMESLCPLPDLADMQKLGGAITYARRYSLSAICGIAADDDDDAEGVKGEPVKTAAAPALPKDYEQWVKGLEKFAATHTESELITEIAESGNDEQKAHLRTDAKWAAMRAAAAKNNKGKAA